MNTPTKTNPVATALNGIRRSAQARLDSWTNALTGLGTVRDKMKYFRFTASDGVSDEELEELYSTDDMAAAICNIVPDEMLRQGLSIHIDAGKDSTLDTSRLIAFLHGRLDELEAREKFNHAMVWANVFGGAAIYVGADDGRNPSEPLNEDAIKTITFLTVMDKRTLRVQAVYDDPQLPKYGEPALYRVTKAGDTSKETYTDIHESRLIVFQGLRTTSARQASNGGWNESLLRMVYEPIKQYQANWAAVSHLMQDAHQAVFKIKGLIDIIASGEKDILQQRMEIVNMARSVAQAILVDAEDESFERQSTNLGGVEGILDKSMLRLSAAARVPATILMAQSPAGMNATGESDIRWFYDTVKAAQTNVLKPRIERIVYMLMRAKDCPSRGVDPEAWSVQFPPLWQMSPEEDAAHKKMIAETDAIYIDKGVVLPEEVTISRFRPDGYSSDWNVSLDLREKALEIEAQRMLTQEPPSNDVVNAPDAQQVSPDVTPAGSTAAVVPNAVDPQSALNGAQVQALQDIIQAVATKQMPRDTGIKMIAAAFPLSEAQANAIMGQVGLTFFVQAAEPYASSAPSVVELNNNSEQKAP